MRLRALLLGGTVIPLGLGMPALALDRSADHRAGLMLAQACPPGMECPSGEQAPTEEAPTAPSGEEQAPEEREQEQEAVPEEPAPEAAPPVKQAPAEAAPEEQEEPAAEEAPEPEAEEAAPEEPAEEAPAEPSTEEAAPEEPSEEAAPEEPSEQAPAEEAQPEEPADQPAAEEAEPDEPAAEEPAAEEEDAPATDGRAEEPADEEDAAEPTAGEEAAEPGADEEREEPAAEEERGEPAAEEEAEPATEESTIERARERQQELRQQEEGDDEAQPGAEEEARDEDAGAGPRTAEEPSTEEETTVERQLEVQGDDEDAERVRTLRSQLREELDQVAGAEDEEADRDDDDRRRRYFDRDERRGDIVEERGDRIIINLGDTYYVEPIIPDEGGRLLYGARDVEVTEASDGYVRTVVYRPDGVQVITVRDRYGYIVRRVKRLPDGVDLVLIDNRYPGYDDQQVLILSDFPPPQISIPPEQYIVELGDASPQSLQGVLLAPPVQELDRRFTLEQVLVNEQVRAYSPRIDLDVITFATGSATIGEDQMPALAALGEAMEAVLAEHPDEVYLIEGHTDAVGSEYDNLILSDQRAEAVAVALSQNFDIPPENLVTEGYGEQYPKVETDGSERRNRRATVRRLTELLAAER